MRFYHSKVNKQNQQTLMKISVQQYITELFILTI